MPSLSEIQSTNATYKISYVPVALFIGGTSGIGRSTAEAFARYTGGNAHIILIGRNATAAREIIDGFTKPDNNTKSEWKHEFIQCDVSLLKNVATTLEALRARVPRVNFVVNSAGEFSLGPREETTEGIDTKLAVAYHSRAAFTLGLLPALEAAHAAGQAASVLSVLAAGRGIAIDLNNLDFSRGEYVPLKVMGSLATYMDLFTEELGARYPTLSFTHMFPGFVNTPLGQKGSKVMGTDLSTYKSAADAGECVFYALVSETKGAKLLYETADKPEKEPVYGHGSSKESRALLEHTEAVVSAFKA